MSDERIQPQLPEPDHRQKLAMQKAAERYQKRTSPCPTAAKPG